MQHNLNGPDTALHSYFARELPPILRVQSGDSVRYTNLHSASWHYATEAGLVFDNRVESQPMGGHCLVGPVYIEGAQPGMTLEIIIGEIIPAHLGWNRGGGEGWDHFEQLGVSGENARFSWEIDVERGEARSDYGLAVPIAPFLGVIGMPPDEEGIHPTIPPRVTGGNIDLKALTAGARLFLPIAVEGGLVSVGDGHAAQGDGEASGTAVECPMLQADLTYVLHPNMKLSTPRAITADAYYSLGFDVDLNKAVYLAMNDMLDWMMALRGLSRQAALSYASTIVDVHVTQFVNFVKGAHARLPRTVAESA